MASLAETISARRAQLGLSQRELATRAGLSNTYIGKLETGFDRHTGVRIVPTVSVLVRIAGALEMTPELLLAQSEFSPSGYEYDVTLDELLTQCRKMTPEQHRSVLDFARYLRSREAEPLAEASE